MKAIHNVSITATFAQSVGNYKLKYNFESNSQPVAPCHALASSW
nr:hypothetical protein [Flavobacterium psychrophilum]